MFMTTLPVHRFRSYAITELVKSDAVYCSFYGTHEMRNNDMMLQSIRNYQNMNNNKLKLYSNIHMQSVRIWLETRRTVTLPFFTCLLFRYHSRYEERVTA